MLDIGNGVKHPPRLIRHSGNKRMKNPPWDQRIARVLVKPLVKSPVTPNQLTVFTLIVALAGAGLLATGDSVQANWGVGLFVLARFLDHFDGELARQKKMTTNDDF